MRFIHLVVFSALLPTSVMAQDAAIIAACQNVYSISTANLTISERKAAEFDSLVDQMCSGSSAKDAFNLNSGMKIVYEAVPIEGNLSFGSDKERQDHICANKESIRQRFETTSDFARTIVLPALASFNGCIALGSAGVKIIPDVTIPRALQIKISKPDPDNIVIQSFDSSPNLVCTSAQVEGTDKSLTASKEFSFKGDFAIQCSRTPATTTDGEKFAPSFVSFTTSRATAPFSLSLPEDVLFTPMLASSSKTKIDELTQALATEQKRASDAEALAKGWETRAQGMTSKAVLMFTGDSPNPGGRGEQFPGGTSIEAMITKMCPGAVQWDVVNYGGEADRTFYVGSCLLPTGGPGGYPIDAIPQ